MKCQGKDLLLQTDWFHCAGLKDSIDSKKEILVTLSPEIRQMLKNIEDLSLRNGNLKLPAEYQGVANTDFFKHLPDRTNFYLKMKYDGSCFDRNGQLLKFEQLGMGDYRAVIHVKGLYIGHHPSGKVVSLQLRVAQLQYISRIPQCMFAPVPLFTQPMNITGTQPNFELSAPNLTKKGRKSTKLQRQNAITEAKIQQEEHRNLESIPAEFFRDAMSDLTNLSSSSLMSNLQASA